MANDPMDKLMGDLHAGVQRAKQRRSLHAEGMSYERAMAAIPTPENGAVVRGSSVMHPGYPIDLTLERASQDEGIVLSLSEDDGNTSASEIFLDHDRAGRLLEHLARLLTSLQGPDEGPTVYGYIGRNGLGEVCFFPRVHAEGIPVPIGAWTDASKWARRTHVGVLRALDPPETV